mmetsp:Transcript_20475/g.38934  ORF Transcript_20475/g.38934 Transcript_20475/m.38934 type:complete len:334 (-) Transcript_20475:592-1593(-)
MINSISFSTSAFTQSLVPAGYEANMMDGTACRSAAGRGRRCQSSSVTNGMKGCKRRSPTSKDHQSAFRTPCTTAVSLDCTRGFISSMNTSHRSYCQKAYTEVVAWAKSYFSSASSVSTTALLSREITHCPASGSAATSLAPSWGVGRKPSPRFIMAKRVAFHSLLHQVRYPCTRRMSRLMSRACVVYATRAKRSASVPHSGMPLGKSSVCPSWAFLTSFASRFPFSRVACRSLREIPSTTWMGSITLPRDLDILRPCASRTMACKYTCLNGTLPVSARLIITMRATQKKRMSCPVSSSAPGKKSSRSGVCSGHPMVEKGNRPEENHVSSTSGS